MSNSAVFVQTLSGVSHLQASKTISVMRFAGPALQGKRQDHRLVLALTKMGRDPPAMSSEKALLEVAREHALAEA